MKEYNNTTFQEVKKKFDAELEEPKTRYSFDLTNLNAMYIVVDTRNGLPVP